jgi:2-dehydropantoate 2-reductase
VLVPHEMQTILWRKLIVNAAINPIAALLNTPNGHVGACEWSRRSVEAVVQEAVAIAEREHVDLQATEQVSSCVAMLDSILLGLTD